MPWDKPQWASVRRARFFALLSMTAEAGRWLEVAVEVAGIDAETVADAFRPGCSGGVPRRDLGAGSGIRAIAAAGLGAKRVLALDIDPQAVKAARENAAANGVQAVVEVREGTLPEGAPGECCDFVVANISGLTIERLAPAFAESLREGGTLIVSGFLEGRVVGGGRAPGAGGGPG